MKTVQQLLSRRVVVNTKDRYGSTPLFPKEDLKPRRARERLRLTAIIVVLLVLD
jgi:hypothetical protein